MRRGPGWEPHAGHSPNFGACYRQTPRTDWAGGSNGQRSAEDEFCENEYLQGMHLTLEYSFQLPIGT